MASDNSREAALFALKRIRRSGTWSGASLGAAINEYDLDSKAKALAVGICLGVLQNMTLCDYYIDRYSSTSKIEPAVRDILRISVYQLIFMDRIPASAAVNEAVRLCKKLGFSRASGFVNAVLRKISAEAHTLPEIEGEGTAKHLSVKYSHPVWLVEELIDTHGYEFTEQFLAENNKPADIALQVNTLRFSADSLLSALNDSGFEAKRHEWQSDCIIAKGRISDMPGYSEGAFYVQNPAAKEAALAAEIQPGISVLDACAAPGGKSFAAAICMNDSGSLLSCDISEKKLKLIENGAERLGLHIISTQAHDARSPFNKTFDVVLADVPCSGYGVIRKKPEIRMKPESERHALPAIQSAILDNLADSVRPGGVLLYSTCTIFEAENESVIKAFLSKHKEFTTEDFTLSNGKSSHGGMYTFWPHIDGTDGFFVCKLRRIT